MDEVYPDSICSTVPDVEEFASSFSPRDPLVPNIRNVVRQVQACIENTSLQLRNDYKHKQAVYQAWSPAASGVRPVTPLTPRSKQNRIAGLGSSGSLCGSPRSSISSLWAAGQQAGLLQHQQGHPVTLPTAASFSDFFAARRNGGVASSNSSSSLDPFRLQTCTAGSTSSLQQSRVQDARNYAAADSARPQCPLVPGSMLEPSAPPNTLLLENLRQQACQQGSTGQHNITPNPTRSQGSGASSGSLATPVSAHSRCGMFDTASLGELSLWGEPLNVSPVSPQRSARAAGLFPASAGGHAGRQQLDRPASPTVLSTFATDCNIAPAVIASSEGRCSEGQDGSSPFVVARPHSMLGSSAHRDACCRGRSCSPTAYRSEGAAGGCRPRSLSPSPRHLICCRCRRQHSLQQHSSCCHLCGNCCQARGSCASSRGGSSGNSSNRAGCGTGAKATAGAAALSNIQRPLQAEISTSSSTSTCACIKAYRIGQRDLLQQHRAGSATAAAAAAADGGGAPNMDSAATDSPADAHGLLQQQPTQISLGADTMPSVGLASKQEVAVTSTGQHAQQSVPTPAAAAAAAASPQHNGMPPELLSTGQAGDAAPAEAPGSDQPDLVQVAFNEVYAAQQNLLNQGSAADPQDIEELSTILQQVLAAAEPQHEQQLREVLGRQQRLLAAQEAYLAEAEVENERVWPELPPLRLPSGLGAQARVSTASAGAATLTPPQQPLEAQPRPAWDDDSPQNWALQQSRLQQQQQGEVMGDAASTRSNSSGGSSAWQQQQQQQQSGPGLGGVDGLRTPTNLHQQSTVFVTQQHLQRSMAPEDRLAAAAAAYEAAESGGKPLQQLLELNRGKAGTRSSRGGRGSVASSVTLDAGHAVSHQDSQQLQQQLYRQQQQQAYSRAASMKQQAVEYDGAAPAYTADSCSGSGSELDLEDAARSLLHCMEAHTSDLSRQVVQDAPNIMTHAAEVQGGQALVVPRTGNGAAAPTQPTAASAGGARTPSNRSIADSAYSVQAVPAAALYGQQEVRCSSVTHATATPQQLPVAAVVTAAMPVAAFGVAAAGVQPLVPPLSFNKHAALAGTAVDGRVLGLSPSLKEVEAAGNLQELAEAISGGGAGLDSSGRDSRAPAIKHALGQRLTSTGTAPSPRTPRVEPSRLPVDAAAGLVPGGSPGAAAGQQLLNSSSGGGSAQSHRMASVRFRSDCFDNVEEAAGRSGSSTQAHPAWASDPRQPELRMHTAMQQQQQQQQAVRRSASGRAGSFELPDSAPSSQEHSCRPSIEGPDHDRQVMRPQTGPRAAATTPYGSLGGFAPAAMPPQDMSGLQQGAVPQQQQAAQDTWSPQPVALQRLQHSADSFRSAGGGLNSPTGGAGRPGKCAGQPQSPGSCQVRSPRVSLAAAATAAAAVAGGSTGGAGSWGGFDDMRSLSMGRQKPPVLISTGSAGVGSSRGSFASRASQAQQQPQPQQQQQPEQLLGISSAASMSKSSATSWRDRQLAMQQELAGQQQQLQQIRSRASSVATTPRGPSMLRSVSRASGHSSIASSAAMLRMAAEQCPQQDQTQQQQQHKEAQLQPPPPPPQQHHHHQVGLAVQQQQQQQQQEVRSAAADVQPKHSPGLHGSVGSYAVNASPCSPREADRDHRPARRQTSSPLQDMLNSIMADRLQERRAGSTMRAALRGWRQYTAAGKAKAHHTGTGRRASKDDSTAAWMQQGQPGTTAASSSISSMSGLLQAAAGKNLRISLQGINSNVLRQSLGMLQGQLDTGEVEGDTVDIVVSGQLCLQRSPSPPQQHHHQQHSQQQVRQPAPLQHSQQQVRQPAPLQQQRRQQQQQVSQRQHRRSSSANGGSDVVRHFDEQLQATKAAVAAASAGAGRAPLQSVLREMQSMIARMEAVCCRDEASGSGSPLTQQAQQECKQSAATQAAQGQQRRHHRASIALDGHSPSPDMLPPRAYCNQRRPGSAGSITDWQQQQQQQQAAAASQACCSPAFARSRSPRRQLMGGGQGGKLRSPDRHKLRGRLHTVQDRLARLEVKMHQAAAMTESPCPCVSPQRPRQQQDSWGAGGSSRFGDGSPLKACWGQADGEWVGLGARGCSLEGKKQVLVGRMQQELEELQQELQQLQQMMPDAYSSGSS